MAFRPCSPVAVGHRMVKRAPITRSRPQWSLSRRPAGQMFDPPELKRVVDHRRYATRGWWELGACLSATAVSAAFPRVLQSVASQMRGNWRP